MARPRIASTPPRAAQAAFGVALAVLGLACSRSEVAPESLAPLVELVAARSVDFVEQIEAAGELKAVEHAKVAAEVAGRITEVLRDEGEAVAQGDVLLRVDPERRELELASTRAQSGEALSAVRESERDLKRIRSLHERGAASDAALDEVDTARRAAEARFRAAEARVGVSERAWRDSEVRAPFAGMVARRYVSRGEFVDTGAPLFELVAIDPVEVEFNLPERDAARVQIGQPVEVRVAPLPDEIFRARVHMVAPTIDPRTRTLRVKGLLENTQGRLKPGLFARVDLGAESRQGVIIVPEEAVLQRAEGAIVFAMGEADRVRRVPVELGMHRDGWVEVRGAIAAGDPVVAQGQARLQEGLVVRSRRRAEEDGLAQGVSAP